MDTQINEKKHYSWQNNNLILSLQVQPKANQNAIIGIYNNKLKVTITSAPTSGKANAHLIKYLAKYFGVPQKQVKIIKGDKNKHKSVMISEPKNNIGDFKR